MVKPIHRSFFVDAVDLAQALLEMSDRYWSKGRGLGKSESKKKWETEYFPDLEKLRKKGDEIFNEFGILFERIPKSPHDLLGRAEFRLVQ